MIMSVKQKIINYVSKRHSQVTYAMGEEVTKIFTTA